MPKIDNFHHRVDYKRHHTLDQLSAEVDRRPNSSTQNGPNDDVINGRG